VPNKAKERDVAERVDIQADGIIASEPGIGIAIAGGTTPPSDGAIGYAPSCLYVHTDASSSVDRILINQGNYASANFDPLGNSISAADLALNSTNEINITFSGVSALAIDDAAIVGNTAASNTAGKNVFIETQDGGTPISGDGGKNGGNFRITAGIATDASATSDQGGGEGGSISFVTQAGGAGDGAGVTGAGGVIRLNSAPGVIFQKHVLTTKTNTATLTAAELLGGLLSTTTTNGYTVTLPSGADLDASIHSQVGANEYFEFVVVNTSPGTVTIAVGSGSWTSLGTLTVATNTSARFRVTRTAGNTFVLYRV